MANIELHYFGEEEGPDENADINDQIDTEPRINSAGQKIRGKDFSWKSKLTFSSPQLYHDSSLYKEKIKDYRTVPENDNEGYLAYDNIQDENED